VQKVLSGSQTNRPTEGSEDPLWAEEYDSSPPARPSITDILGQLYDEAKTWSPTNRRLSPPTPLTYGLPENYSDEFHWILKSPNPTHGPCVSIVGLMKECELTQFLREMILKMLHLVTLGGSTLALATS